jgi:glucose-6-phosphate 1-epimerase
MFCVSAIEEGINGQSKVSLRSDDEMHECDVYLFGGTITSWKHSGHQKLFCSPITPFNGKAAIRGGIPLVFPQFGRPDERMPQHGFARTSMWDLKQSKSDTKSSSVVLQLKSSAETLAVWPFEFTLLYTIELSALGLKSSFSAINSGSTEFQCGALLHTYIAVPSIDSVLVKGFRGCSFIDKMNMAAAGAELPVDNRENAVITCEVDRIYLDTTTTSAADVAGEDGLCVSEEQQQYSTPPILVRNSASGSPSSSGNVLVSVNRKAYIVQAPALTDNGANSAESGQTSAPCAHTRRLAVDTVLWNAWVAKCMSIGDLEDDAFLRYVCVEPGIAARQETVLPGEALVLEQFLS